jgi:hypothetical protein
MQPNRGRRGPEATPYTTSRRKAAEALREELEQPMSQEDFEGEFIPEAQRSMDLQRMFQESKPGQMFYQNWGACVPELVVQ